MSVNPQYNGPINTANPIPDGESRISIYGFKPSLALAAVALATFAIITILHIWYIFKSRLTRSFQILLAFGSLMELVGYGFRAGSAKNPFKVINFIIQYFMIVCAPVFYTTALYLSLLYIIRRLRRESLWITPLSPKAMLWTFATIDVVTTALQICGAALIGVSESKRADGEVPPISTESANNILLAGLAIQNFSFLVFLSIFAVIVFRNSKIRSHGGTHEKPFSAGDGNNGYSGETIGRDEAGLLDKLPKSYIWVVTISSLALFLRTLFRLAETADGVFGFASTSEAYFGVLEYAPVVVGIGLWAALPLYRMLHARH
ncbi:hypothetical protein P389DRAFT_57386 [Cystobasidium minutum MCA 4210]|uniref:uncharacterized protein n=1 Tax=Cystobasidium minutum MCA 4210 TaxID=1397322 RepID=UPI0034CF8587|eukprot:jgi/Rhomi1/57386/CE57385_461